jgi:hypothetical protein
VQRYDCSSDVDGGGCGGNTNQQCRDGGCGGGSVLCTEWCRAGSVAPNTGGGAGGGASGGRHTASAGQGRPNRGRAALRQQQRRRPGVRGGGGDTNQQCRDGGCGGGSVLCAEWCQAQAGSVAPSAGGGGPDVQPSPATFGDPLVIRGHGCGAIGWIPMAIGWIPMATASTRGDVERARNQ